MSQGGTNDWEPLGGSVKQSRPTGGAEGLKGELGLTSYDLDDLELDGTTADCSIAKTSSSSSSYNNSSATQLMLCT